MGRYLVLFGGPSIIMWLLKSKEPFPSGSERGAPLLALKMQEKGLEPLEAGNDEEMDSPLEPLAKATAPLTHLTQSSETHVEFLSYRNVIINLG